MSIEAVLNCCKGVVCLAVLALLLLLWQWLVRALEGWRIQRDWRHGGNTGPVRRPRHG